MATPKSANERIRRKIKRSKVSPDDPVGDKTGKIISKKPANNDPDRKHRIKNKNDKIAREFVEFYKTGKNPNKTFLPLIEDLISIAIENAGERRLPYEIGRLNELKESVLNEGLEIFDINPQTFNISPERVDKMYKRGIISKTEYIYYLASQHARKIIEIKSSLPDMPSNEWDEISSGGDVPDKYRDHSDINNSMIATVDAELINNLKKIL